MFDTNDSCADDLSVSLTFGRVLSSNFCPEDLRAVEDFEFLGPINLNFVGNVGTFDDGCVVTVA